jgi:putative phosphoesterase
VRGAGAARTLRVGLVADTHVGEFIERLPGWVPEALEGCDLLLHAGDLSVPGVLDDLEAIAPVRAVRGDHDRDAGHLPRSLVATVGGWRVGVTHGAVSRHWDTAVTLREAYGRPFDWQRRVHRHVLTRLGAVDAAVYGHWHAPAVERVASALVVCPGAVCPWGSLEGGRPPRPGAEGVADRVVRRFRSRLGDDLMRPSVGVLEIGSSGIRPVLIPAPAA